jgi:rubrerythrin
MKKLLVYLLSATVSIALLTSCGTKQNKATAEEKTSSQQSQSQTVTDLKAAIDGEATASAKYAAYAEQAAKEGFASIEAMFKATSKAESIHLKNHLHMLYTISGIKQYKPHIEAISTLSTADNLKAVIKAEKYESKTMYPKFLSDAKAEFEDGAVLSFKLAMGAEKNHAKLYSDALASIKGKVKLQSVYYVCPVCGNVYAGKPASVCELCGTPSNMFLKYTVQK